MPAKVIEVIEGAGPRGEKGFSPVLGGEVVGDRAVLKVVSWTGGQGTAPTLIGYVGETGLVADPADAVNLYDGSFATVEQGALADTALQPEAIGVSVQAYDGDLSAIAALTSSANKFPYATGAGTWALADLSAFARTLLDDADAAAMRETLELGSAATQSSSAFQAADIDLAAIAGQIYAANDLPYATGPGAWSKTTISTAGRALIDDADAAAMRETLELGTASTVNIGTSGAVIPLLSTLNVFGVQQQVDRSGGPIAWIANRTDSATNSGFEARTTGGSVYFGYGAAGTFAVDGDNNLASNPWFSVSATSIQYSGSEIFRRANILATVSQSSGVPTGGIIETGSNANGTYVRFADGTQICWHTSSNADGITTADGSLFRSSSDLTWTYPIAFVSGNAPYAHIAASRNDRSVGTSATASPTATTHTFRIWSSTSLSAAGTVFLRHYAIGRWF